MVEVWRTRLRIRRRSDDCAWNKGLNWSRRDRASDRKARTEEIQSGSLSGAATLAPCQERNASSIFFFFFFFASKTSTGPAGQRRRWLQIDNHQYSLSGFLDLLLSSFPNYSILYQKLFINVFHSQQSAQVLNYPKTLLISNDWFFLRWTPRCWASVAFLWNVERRHGGVFLSIDAANESDARRKKRRNRGRWESPSQFEAFDSGTSSLVPSVSAHLWK